MSDSPRWTGDPLPAGLTQDDRLGWEVAATIVLRFVPDPQTGRRRGVSVEFHSDIPKVVLADRLMSVVQELMTHDDFQEGVSLRRMGPDGPEGET
jgi:hypothetical protein